METSAESYLSNVVNASVTMKGEALTQASRGYWSILSGIGEKPLESSS
jgi:hypothetical protein